MWDEYVQAYLYAYITFVSHKWKKQRFKFPNMCLLAQFPDNFLHAFLHDTFNIYGLFMVVLFCQYGYI